MSLHSTMTMSERKLQAAAICREVLGAREMDLGRKMNTPKDIMLEELSLSSNRGSRLFKKRQIRSEKYTFEKANNEANEQTNSECPGLQITLFCCYQWLQMGLSPGDDLTLQPLQHNGAVPSAEATAENGDCPDGDQQPGTPPNTPDAKTLDPESIAPGYGGPLQDVPPEKFNSTAVPRSYHSPWDQALVNDPSLAEVLSPKTPSPEPKPEVPEYKSFNRVATPFGAYEPPQLSVLKTLELDPPPSDSPAPAEAQETTATRPTFNRTALGWVGDGAPLVLPVIDLEGVALPESDDL